MRHTWQLQDAKARFSEVVRLAASEGPQIVTYRGVETAVVMSIEEYRRLASDPAWENAYRRMIARLDEGASLGGLSVERDELHDR